MATIDSKLLEILVCPVTKGKLEYDRENQRLISRQAKLSFAITDGIPNLLVDQATPLDSVDDSES